MRPSMRRGYSTQHLDELVRCVASSQVGYSIAQPSRLSHMSRALSRRDRLGAPCQRRLVASTASIASGQARSRRATRVPPRSWTTSWRTGGGSPPLRAHPVDEAFEHVGGERASSVWKGEDAAEHRGATRPRAIDAIERLPNPTLADETQRIIERPLDPTL